jgi:hypothetical protein
MTTKNYCGTTGSEQRQETIVIPVRQGGVFTMTSGKGGAQLLREHFYRTIQPFDCSALHCISHPFGRAFQGKKVRRAFINAKEGVQIA